MRDAAVAALTASGIEVIDLDIVTTPGVAMMVKHLSADAGDDRHRIAQSDPMERPEIPQPPGDRPAAGGCGSRSTQLYDEQRRVSCAVEKLVPPKKNSETHALHVKRVLDYVDVLGISTKRFKVVLDSVNGAGCVATATLLNKLGCQLVHLNATPDGQFPHEPEPTEKNLTGLATK